MHTSRWCAPSFSGAAASGTDGQGRLAGCWVFPAARPRFPRPCPGLRRPAGPSFSASPSYASSWVLACPEPAFRREAHPAPRRRRARARPRFGWGLLSDPRLKPQGEMTSLRRRASPPRATFESRWCSSEPIVASPPIVLRTMGYWSYRSHWSHLGKPSGLSLRSHHQPDPQGPLKIALGKGPDVGAGDRVNAAIVLVCVVHRPSLERIQSRAERLR